MINAFLEDDIVPSNLKMAVARPLLKKPSRHPTILDNYQPDSDLSFLSKVVERTVVSQFQRFLEEDILRSFQPSFTPGFGTAGKKIGFCFSTSTPHVSGFLILVNSLEAYLGTKWHIK